MDELFNDYEDLQFEYNNDCNQTAPWQDQTSFVLSGLCFLSLILSLPGLALGIYEYFYKNNISDLRTERLLFYLSCGSAVFSLAGSFQWIAYLQRDQHHNYTTDHYDKGPAGTPCIILGYTWLTCAIFLTVITLSLGVHFFLLICQPKQLSVTREEKIKKHRRLEILYVTIATVLALCISPLPFVDGSFGYNRWICWINIRQHCSDQYTKVGFYLVAVLYFFIAISFFFTFCMALTAQTMICLKKHSTKNLYLPVVLTYLVLSLTVIAIVWIVNFPPDQQVRTIDYIQSVSTMSIGSAFITGSLVSPIAVLHKKFSNCNRYKRRSLSVLNQPDKRPPRYHAINSSIMTPSAFTGPSSRNRTTYWDSPATNEINSSHFDDEN